MSHSSKTRTYDHKGQIPPFAPICPHFNPSPGQQIKSFLTPCDRYFKGAPIIIITIIIMAAHTIGVKSAQPRNYCLRSSGFRGVTCGFFLDIRPLFPFFDDDDTKTAGGHFTSAIKLWFRLGLGFAGPTFEKV